MYDFPARPAVPSPTQRRLPAVSDHIRAMPSDFDVPRFLDDLTAGLRPLTLVDDAIVGVIRWVDDFATDGAHNCEADVNARELWALAPEDVPALVMGEPDWTVIVLCPTCETARARDGWLLTPTVWDRGVA